MGGRHAATTEERELTVVTTTVALALSAIIQAAVHGKHVVRRIDGYNFRGTARSVGDINGMFAHGDTPVLECYLRVTLDGGADTFWPIAELVRDHAENLFLIGV